MKTSLSNIEMPLGQIPENQEEMVSQSQNKKSVNFSKVMDNIQTSKTYQEDEIMGDRPISPIIKKPVPPSKQIMEPSLLIDDTNLGVTPITKDR